MTRAPTREPRFGQLIVELGKWRFEAQTIPERQPLTIIVTVEVLCEPGAPVDRDHDRLLREFMQADDE
jgi:hypothetical protein